MYIILSIYSKNINSLTNFLKFFYKFRKKRDFRLVFNTKQSQKKKKNCFISVLKSPHVNKKAQEQFDSSVHKKQLKIKVSQINRFLFIWKWTKKRLFVDLKIKIDFLFEQDLIITSAVKTTNSERFIATIFKPTPNYASKNSYQKFSKTLKKKKLSLHFLVKQTFLRITDVNGEKLLKTYYQ